MTPSAGQARGDLPTGKSQAEKALRKATKDWRAAKKRERAAREELAVLVRHVVASGALNENKVAGVTDIPRMTVRKMLGKDARD
jgi:hypothetical protein